MNEKQIHSPEKILELVTYEVVQSVSKYLYFTL